MRRFKHKRAAACCMAMVLLFQIGLFIVPAGAEAGHLFDGAEPQILYNSAALEPDMQLPPDAQLVARYGFTATASQLRDAGAVPVPGLPASLAAVAGRSDIWGQCPEGTPFVVGTITVDDQGAATATFDLAEWDLEDAVSIEVTAALPCRLNGAETVTDTESGLSSLTIGAVTVGVAGQADAVKITRVTIERQGGAVEDGDTVTTTDTLAIRYEFSVSPAGAQAIKALLTQTGAAGYTLTLPQPLIVGDTVTAPLKATDGQTGQEVQYGTLSAQGERVTITFEGDFWEHLQYYALGLEAYFTITCQLSEALTQDGQAYEVVFHEDATFELVLKEPPPVEKGPHNLTKGGVYDKSTGIITWTVTLAPGENNPILLPLILSDTYDHNDLHQYVADSFRVNGAVVDAVTLSVDQNGTKTTLIYTLTGGEDTSITQPLAFTYQTRLTPAAYGLYAQSTEQNPFPPLSNIASAAFDGQILTAQAAVTPQMQLLKKELTNPSGTATSAAITSNPQYWKLTVTSGNLGITDLMLYDMLPRGFKLVENSFEIVGYQDTALTGPAPKAVGGHVAVSNPAEGGTLMTITIPPGESALYDPVYVITYRTEIDPLYVSGQGSHKESGSDNFPGETLTNHAWLEFKLPLGTGDGTADIILPRVEKGVTVNTNIILKGHTKNGFGSKVASTATAPLLAGDNDNTFWWYLTVNPYETHIVAATVTDMLPPGLAYVEGSFTIDDGLKPVITFDETLGIGTDGDRQVLTFCIEELGAQRAVIWFQTKITDAQLYLNSATAKSYSNTVSFVGDVRVDGITYPNLKDSHTNTAYVKSTMLTKSGAYNYAAKTLSWTVEVNRNKVDLGDQATLTDILPNTLALVPGSVKIRIGGGVAQTVTGCTTVSNGNGTDTLTIPLGNLGRNTAVVTFDTLVDVDNYQDAAGRYPFKSTGAFEIPNTVTLRHGLFCADAATQVPVVNTILDKSGQYADGKVTYTIKINPTGLNLAIHDLALRDTMSPGLRLDPASIKLYAVTVGADGTFPHISTGILAEDFTWTYDAAENSFSVKLPGSGSYYLQYVCYVTGSAPGAVSNTVAFTGSTGTPIYTSVATSSVTVSSGGQFIPLSTRLTVKKVDASHGNAPLAGMTFRLYGTAEGKELLWGEATTDAGGTAVFSALAPGLTYRLEEDTGDAPYSGTGALVVESSKGGAPGALAEYTFTLTGSSDTITLTVSNQRKGYPVIFGKVNGRGNGLAGAVFRLTEIAAEGETLTMPYTATATSGPEGRVTFDSIPWGVYELVETAAPAGYTASTAVYTVTVGQDGRVIILDGDRQTDTGSVDGALLPCILNTPKGNGPEPETPPDPKPDPQPGPQPKPEPEPEPDPDPQPGPEPQTEPQTEPEPQPTPRPTPTPPTPPVTQGTLLIPDPDGGFWELDESGTPLGKWVWDEEAEEWVLDTDIPLSDFPGLPQGFVLPQTGIAVPPSAALLLAGTALMAAGGAVAYLPRRKGRQQPKT